MDCPEITDLALHVEGGALADDIKAHIKECDACQEAIQELEEEVLSLQIPLSEIWFREHVSCVERETLGAYLKGKIDGELKEYIRFHVEDLECPFCQSRLEREQLSTSEEGRRNISQSRRKTGKATSDLVESLREIS